MMKKNYRNLEHGDVLVYKIKSKEKDYCGKYFVYIRYNPAEWEKYYEGKKISYKHGQVFALAITKKKELPTIDNVLDSIEYISHDDYYFEKDTVDIVYGKKYKNLIPDEYGLYHCFLKQLSFCTKEERELETAFYIGNIPNYKPFNLFIKEELHGFIYDSSIGKMEEHLINWNYLKEKTFNKKEFYSEERVNWLKKEYYFRLLYIQNNNRKKSLEGPSYCYGHGAGIYDNEVSMYVKRVFEICFNDKINYIDFMNSLWQPMYYYVMDNNDFFIAYIVLADLLIQKEMLDNNFKNLAISVIKSDLKNNWEGRNDYQERLLVLNELLNKLIEFTPNEDTEYIFDGRDSFIDCDYNKVDKLSIPSLKIKCINCFNYIEGAFQIYDPSIVTYNFGWGPGLYDCDVALDVKGDYQNFLKNGKRNNESHKEIIENLLNYESDIIKDKFEGPIFWMVLANEELKRGFLTNKIRDKAIKSIKKDLINWKYHEEYKKREKILNKLKDKLENYKEN